MVRAFILLALIPSLVVAATYNTDADPTAAEIQALVDGASDGDTIIIADGSHLMSSKITITGKGITLKGGGEQRYVGSSRSLRDFATGPVTFNLYTAGGEIDVASAPIEVGDRLRFTYPVNESYMEGAVTAWSSPAVTVDVDTVSGAGGTDVGTDTGDESWWVVTKDPVTELVRNFDPTTGDGMLDITEDDSHRVTVDGIAFRVGTGDDDLLNLNYGGEPSAPIVLKNCSFHMAGTNGIAVRANTNRGIAWKCSFIAGFERADGGSSSQGVNMDVPIDSSWTTVSTFGADDADGESNFYIEDSFFYGFRDSAIDTDDNSRLNCRYTIFDNSSVGGHGQGTSAKGARHYEYTNSWFLYRDAGNGRSLNMSRGFVHTRGGTGIFYNLHMESMATSTWTSGAEKTFHFMVEGINDDRGMYACWGNGTPGESTWPATEYPYPRQQGYGYVDGSGTTNPTHGYQGDPEPVYVWDLSGTIETETSWVHTYNPVPCTGADSPGAYIKVDADGDANIDGDIIYNVAKPGYTEYTYPHPLVASAEAGAAYGGRLRFDGTGAKPVRTDGTGQPIIFDQ